MKKKKKNLNEGMVMLASLLPVGNLIGLRQRRDNFKFNGLESIGNSNFKNNVKKNDTLIKEEYFHTEDDLLRCITFQDLIDAVFSNEQVISKESIMKVWKEMKTDALADAEHELKQNMDKIIENLNNSRK